MTRHTHPLFIASIIWGLMRLGNGRFKAKKEADLNMIHIGEERYEIPDAVPEGG